MIETAGLRNIVGPRLMKVNRVPSRSILPEMRRSGQLSQQKARLSANTGTRLTVVACLPRQLQFRLKTTISPCHTLIAVANCAEVMTVVRQQHVDLLLIDPSIHGESDTEMVAKVIDAFPSLAVVVYTVMTHATVGTVYELTKRGLHNAVLYGFDDTPERLALLFDGLPPRLLLPAVLKAMHIERSTLPPIVRQRVRDVLETPTLFDSVAAFARSVHVSRPSLYIVFQNAGLGPPGRLLVGARLIRAYAYLMDPGLAFSSAAVKVGWNDARTLKRYLERVFGMPVARLRQYKDTADIVKRLVVWMRSG